MKFQIVKQNLLEENNYNNFIEFIKDMKYTQIYMRYNHLYISLFFNYLIILILFMFTITALFIMPLIGLIDQDFNYLMRSILIDRDFNYFIMIDLLISILPSLLIFVYLIYLDYKHLNNMIDCEINQLQDKLNEEYVDKDDHEKVYLLHELIKNYDLDYSSVDQSDDHRLKLELNTNDFMKFERELYKDEDVYKELKDNMLNDQILNEEETQKFYYEYIDHKIKPQQKRIKSLDERHDLNQRLKNKNKRH